MDLAKILYHENDPPIRLEHCFAILKNEIKWSTIDVGMSSPATMSPNIDVDLDSDNLVESVPKTQYNSEISRQKKRAIGRKAAKIAKQKRPANSESSVKYKALSLLNSRRETMDKYWKYQQK